MEKINQSLEVTESEIKVNSVAGPVGKIDMSDGQLLDMLNKQCPAITSISRVGGDESSVAVTMSFPIKASNFERKNIETMFEAAEAAMMWIADYITTPQALKAIAKDLKPMLNDEN